MVSREYSITKMKKYLERDVESLCANKCQSTGLNGYGQILYINKFC